MKTCPSHSVIPAKAGTQLTASAKRAMGSRFRGNDTGDEGRTS